MKTSCLFRMLVLMVVLSWASLWSSSSHALLLATCETWEQVTDNVGSYTGTFPQGTQTDDVTPTFTCVIQQQLMSNPPLPAGYVVHFFRDGAHVGTVTSCSGSTCTWTDPGPVSLGPHYWNSRLYETATGLYTTDNSLSTARILRRVGFVVSTCTGGPVTCLGDTSWVGTGGTVAPEGFVMAWIGLAVAVFGVGFYGGVKA